MAELLSRMSPGEFIALMVFAGAFFCGLVGIIMGVGLEYRKVALAAALKKDMIERGMTPKEIRLIMEAGSKNSQIPDKSPAEVEV
jgi:hypothetical protein